MAIKKINKYADYRYKIVTPEELREALWQIEQGYYKDMEDYIDSYTVSEKRRMKREDAEQMKNAETRKGRKAA